MRDQPSPATWKGHWKSSVVLVFLFGIFWLWLLVSTGALYSGFQLVDDHEILRIKKDLNASDSLTETMANWISRDLSIRFRAAYYAHRILQTALFGSNFLMWHYYIALLAVIASTLVYFVGRLISLNTVESFVLSLLIFIGPQSAIWWRLGPTETLGMVLLSASMLFHGLAAKRTQDFYALEITAFLTSLAASLTKESFALFLPSIFFYRTLVSFYNLRISWRRALQKNIVPGIILTTICFVELLFIYFYVGTERIGYAGVEGLTFRKALTICFQFSQINSLWRIITVLAVFILLIGFRQPNITAPLPSWKPIAVFTILMSVSILFPQAVLYAKSGLADRYLLPGVTAYSFCFLLLFNTGRRLNLISRTASVVFILLVSIALARDVHYHVLPAARVYSEEARGTLNLISEIGRSTDHSSKIVIVADPARNYEQTFALIYYLTEEMARPNIRIVMLFDPTTYDSRQNLICKQFEGQFRDSIVSNAAELQTRCFVVFDGLEKLRLIRGPYLNPAIYQKRDHSIATTFCRGGS